MQFNDGETMKRLFLVVLSVAVLSGCSTYNRLRSNNVAKRPVPQAMPQKASAATQQPGTPAGTPTGTPILTDADGAEIERVPFRAGVSTVTVENMAKKEGCWGLQGAGLMTPPGPVEVYRLICDNGAVYMAKCELRQCKRMPPPGRPRMQ